MKAENAEKIFRVLLGLLLLGIFFFVYAIDVHAQYNYDHVNVTTRVNVTNAFPEILNVSIDNGAANITLSAGGSRTVTCNATIRDWSGFNDISNVNATFYYYLNQSGQQNDDNEHYTNYSCAEINNDGLYTANYTCTFQVRYFANNGTWHCNVTVNDTQQLTDSYNVSTIINPLYALNVTDVIDYGNLSVLDYSQNISANITNFGNVAINVSVLGYGRTVGDGIGLVCAYGTNISVENQRFYNSLVDWDSKVQLSASNQDMNLTLTQQVDDSTPVLWNTFWQLYVPPNPFGVCNGTVRFTATAI